MDAASRTIALKDHLEEDVGQVTVYNLIGDIVAYKINRDLPTHGVAAGDILVVRKQKKFEANNLMLFYHDKDGELQTGKKLETHAVYQTNKNRTTKLTDVRVIGRVVQIIKNLDD